MDGTPVGTPGQVCCWLDRICVAVTVVFGVWLALSQGLYIASLAGILVPVLYTIKAAIPRRERYARAYSENICFTKSIHLPLSLGPFVTCTCLGVGTLIHCVMHQVGVLGGLVYAAVALPAASYEALRQPWWDWVMAFMWAVGMIQPVVGWLAFQDARTLPQRDKWIWI